MLKVEFHQLNHKNASNIQNKNFPWKCQKSVKLSVKTVLQALSLDVSEGFGDPYTRQEDSVCNWVTPRFDMDAFDKLDFRRILWAKLQEQLFQQKSCHGQFLLGL